MDSESNQIAKLVLQHFHNLPKKGKPLSNEWTTLAAIIAQTTSPKENKFEVISCATGTKCLGKGELSPFGDVVSDFHAEVLARRSLLCYLFDQIKLTQSGSKKSKLQPCQDDNDSKIQQFFLKPEVKLHLFVSQLPCGDSAIIIDQDSNEDQPDAKKPKLEVTNRTGAKLQVGPLVYEEVQSVGKCRVKPGKGDPTLSMSCSDKIAKWQMFGLQGSLLGNFIPEPIRLSSIIIGSSVPFCKSSLDRAIFDRFNDNDELKKLSSDSDFHVLLEKYFKPNVFQASFNFSNIFNPNSTKHACPSSITWYLTDWKGENVEVIVNGRKQGAIKKSFGKTSAMVDVCRKIIFQGFLNIYQQCNSSNANSELTYVNAKKMNQSYVKCWNLVKNVVMKGWTTKPDNLEIN